MIQEILQTKIIERKKYIKSIVDFLGAPLIKVLIGSRRVGKSSILKNIIQKEWLNSKKWVAKIESIW